MGDLPWTIRRLAILVVLATPGGCGGGSGPPPIQFSFRKSQVPAHGMVLGIQNLSDDEVLTKLEIKVRSPDENTARSHLLGGVIRPHDTVTAGWMELDGWKLKPGDHVEVRCSGYSSPKATIVPEP